MIEFLASLHTYDQEETTQTVWKWIRDFFNNEEGICYYKHPVLKITTGIVAELTLLLRNNHPLAIRCLPYQIDEISEANEDSWTVNGESHESPILELEDFTVVLRSKFQRDRSLRGRV